MGLLLHFPKGIAKRSAEIKLVLLLAPGTAAFTRKQVIVEDIATDPLWKDYKSYALVEGLRSCWSTPIFNSHEELLGTFALYYTEARKPTEHDLELIEEIVEVTESAIEARKDDFKKMVGL